MSPSAASTEATSARRSGEASATACANIAFVKYWGNRDAALRLPYNSSISMNLDAATTTTTVAFDSGLASDRVTINGEAVSPPAASRVTAQLDLVRSLAGLETPAAVSSANTFPAGTGIASSASAFAALTAAAVAAAGLSLTEPQLSALARRGSGSAARSIPGGYVEWHAGQSDETSFAESIAPPGHWDLVDLVAVVSREHKAIGSTTGHTAAEASSLFGARLAALDRTLVEVKAALLARDLAALGPLIEAEALSLHAIALTGNPAALYWTGGTLDILHAVPRWRADGLAVYFTLDAGPNVHLICENRDADDVRSAIEALSVVADVLVNRPGPGVRVH